MNCAFIADWNSLNVEMNCGSFNGGGVQGGVQGGLFGAMDSLKVHARYEEWLVGPYHLS